MSLVSTFLVVFLLGLCLVPPVLLRRASGHASDYFIASYPIPPQVVRNSSIGRVLRIVILGPLFVWGAKGELWPVVIAAVCFSLGSSLMAILRRPILEFLRSALDREQSITIHAFIAHQYGNDSRVRVFAAGLTIFSLLGLIAAEAFGAASLLQPFMSDAGAPTLVAMLVLLLLMALCTIPSGNSGTMFAAQSLIGAIYFGFFGSAVLFLYLLASDLRPLPPNGALAILFLVCFCIAILCYRHTKYVDTSLPTSPDGRPGEIYKRTFKILNAAISVLAVLVILIALTEFYFWGISSLVRNSAAALITGVQMPGLALIGVALLSLIYPFVDSTNWQHIVVLVKNEAATSVESIAFDSQRAFFWNYGIEGPMLWLFTATLGALAVVSTETPIGFDVVRDFTEQLIAFDNEISNAILTLLLLSVIAIAVFAMSLAFSTVVCTIRYDVLPVFRPGPVPGTDAKGNAVATRSAVVIGLTLAVVATGAFGTLGNLLQMRLDSDLFVRLVVFFLGVQLSLAPLVFVVVVNRAVSRSADPKKALLTLGLTAPAVIGAIAIYFLSGAVPS